MADYFEQAVAAAQGVSPKTVANWITGELFALLNQAQAGIESGLVTPPALAELVSDGGARRDQSGKRQSGAGRDVPAARLLDEIVAERGLRQISDADVIAGLVAGALAENPEQVAAYLGGKETVSRWLFGQVMRLAKGQANPQVVQQELERQLALKRIESDENH